jgi:hypothetical protein
MVRALECTPVVSTWAREVILTEDETLAVEFKDGFCCEYAGTTRETYQQCVAWGSTGRFIHHFFYPPDYRRGEPTWPYRPVAPGCEVVMKIQKDEVDVGTESTLDFQTGTNTTLTVTDDAANNRVQVKIDVAGGGGTTGTNGGGSLGSAYTLTNSWADAGLSVNLPSAGTYLVLCSAGCSMSDDTAGSAAMVRLRNTTTSQTLGTQSATFTQAAFTANHGVASFNAVVTTAGAEVISLQAQYQAVGMSPSGSVTEGMISYVRLA